MNARFVVDGHEFANEESAFTGDGQYPPFVVFDVAKQENLPGEYPTRGQAQAAADKANRLGVGVVQPPVLGDRYTGHNDKGDQQ